MMTPEKRAKLLHHAADNPDARFISKRLNVNYNLADTYAVDFNYLINNQQFDDWEIYEEPKDEVSYDYVKFGLYNNVDDMFSSLMNKNDYYAIKITKSPNGEVKVEVVK
jgi:hypothetical protein